MSSLSDVKICSKCKKEKSLIDFKKSIYVDDFWNSCKECREKSRASHQKHREKQNERNRRYYQSNREMAREREINRKYKINRWYLEGLFIEQKSKCAICTDYIHHGNYAIDHCHDSGEVRGLLCHQCNTGIGNLMDSPEIIERAAAYLRERGHYGKFVCEAVDDHAPRC